MMNLKTRIAKNSKKLSSKRRFDIAPRMAMANLFDNKNFKSWTKYSKEMAAFIITRWACRMIDKMREQEDETPSQGN
jgi:hypothetical protein